VPMKRCRCQGCSAAVRRPRYAPPQEGRRRIKASPDAEDLARFRAMSPIAHVDAVTAPLLFMLGAKDQRCDLVLWLGNTLGQTRVQVRCLPAGLWTLNRPSRRVHPPLAPRFWRGKLPVLNVFEHALHHTLMIRSRARLGRVPLVDAKRYVAALRARKGAPPARIFVFDEDTHALDRPQTEFEQWLNTVAFFREHVN